VLLLLMPGFQAAATRPDRVANAGERDTSMPAAQLPLGPSVREGRSDRLTRKFNAVILPKRSADSIGRNVRLGVAVESHRSPLAHPAFVGPIRKGPR
jgi:hypothetical protein